MTNCKHKNAYGGWSHTDYLVYCPDCGQEIENQKENLAEQKSLNGFEFSESAYQEYLDWQKREAQSIEEIYGKDEE